MKTRYDDEAVFLCVEECWGYGDQGVREGALCLERHGAVRHLPDCFERLPDDDERAVFLRHELEARRRRIEEFDREEARQRLEAKQKRITRQSEESFWRESATFLARREAGLDDLPDPGLEVAEEKFLEEQRVARLPDDPGQFWDESTMALERFKAEQILPRDLREKWEER